MFEEKEKEKKYKTVRKITKKRLMNIALYYLKRFETSTDNLRSVLKRRVDKYAFQEKEYNREEADLWICEIVDDFEKRGYVNDRRFADIKVGSYINSGKSERFIKNKLKQKGISEDVVENLLEEKEYSPKEAALKFAKKKKLGPFRLDEEKRQEFKQKDMQKMVLAGFSYEDVIEILEMEFFEENF